MGVSWVFDLTPNESSGKSGTQLVNEIHKQLEAHGAEKCGSFEVDSTPYHPKDTVRESSPNAPNKVLHLCHHSEFPLSSFSIILDCVEPHPRVLHTVSDRQLDQVLDVIKPTFSPRPLQTAEVRGSVFKITDFVIRPGVVTVGASYKGVLLEVEYSACSIAAVCRDLMREFCQSLLGAQINSCSKHIQQRTRQPQYYNAVDTLVQYLEFFQQFRKTQQITAPGFGQPPPYAMQPQI